MVYNLYRRVDPDDIEGSFGRMLPYLTQTQIYARRLAARYSWVYLAQKSVIERGVFGPPPFSGVPPPSRTPGEFWGMDMERYIPAARTATTGVPLETLNSRAVRGIKSQIGAGVPPSAATQVSAARANMLTRTETARFARQATKNAVDMLSDTGFVRYRRVPAPGACSYCLALASRGAVYRDEQTALASHQSCRCTLSAERNPNRINETQIHPDDMKEIEVTFVNSNTGRYNDWNADLSHWDWLNRPGNRPPDALFASRRSSGTYR